jgi:H+/Cl- antiporter ClcA
MADTGISAEQARATMRSKQYVVLLVLTAFVGIVVSVAAWCFLELVYQIQQELFTHLPHALGYPNGPPVWWPLPILAIAGLIVALTIVRLPGEGGHIPARGLAAGGAPRPADLPGILLAGIATLGLGLVLGPETPLIALGAGLGVLAIRMARKDAPDQVVVVVAAAGSFAALSFVFTSPLIAAVILIEATGIGGPRLPLVLLPGLLAAGIGTLVSIGIGSFTGLSTSAYALGALPLPKFGPVHIANFGWTIALAAVIAVVTQMIMWGGLKTYAVVRDRALLLLAPVGLIIAGLAIAFSQATGKGIDEVLFSGQDQLPGLVSHATTYSLGALALLLVCKGLAYTLSLGSFRGGPTFPAMFLGAAGGIMASRLPGFPLTAAVGVGMAAAVVGVLRLPLTAVVIGTVLTAKSGDAVGPLIIVAAVVSYVVTLVVSERLTGSPSSAAAPAAQAGSSSPAASSGDTTQRAEAPP